MACSCEAGGTAGGGGSGVGATGGQGAGGSGGQGAGSGACTPGQVQPCYGGPPGTEGVGVCQAGTEECAPDGSGFGACEGEILPSLDHCSTPADEDCDLGSTCAVSQTWSVAFGASGANNSVQDIDVDSQGNVFVMIEATALDVGNGPEYGLGLVKIDPTGTVLWTKVIPISRLGGEVHVGPSGDVWLTGGFFGEVDFGGGTLSTNSANSIHHAFLVRFDNDGNHQFSTSWGSGQSSLGQAVAVDQNGDVIVGGRYHGSINFGGGELTPNGGNNDLFLAKSSPTGTHLWSKDADSANCEVRSIVVDPSDNSYLISAFTTGAVDLGGGPIAPPAGSQTDILIAKLDSTGAPIFATTYGASGIQLVDQAVLDASGNILVTGAYGDSFGFGGAVMGAATSQDVYSALLDGGGAHLWSRTYVSGFTQSPGEVAADGLGNAYVIGSFTQTVDFGAGSTTSAGQHDVFLAKYQSSGAALWSQRFGDAAFQVGRSVVIDADNAPIIAGGFSGTVDFGDGPMGAVGTVDGFVAKLSP